MSLVSLVEWDVSLGLADVSWGEGRRWGGGGGEVGVGGVRAIRTASKETRALMIQKL